MKVKAKKIAKIFKDERDLIGRDPFAEAVHENLLYAVCGELSRQNEYFDWKAFLKDAGEKGE